MKNNKQDCYSYEQWTEYYLGSITKEQMEIMDEHLTLCETCLSRYMQVVENGVLEDEDLLPETFVDDLMQEVHKQNNKNRCNMLIYYAAAACVTLMFMGVGVFGHIHQSFEYRTQMRVCCQQSRGIFEQGWTDKLAEGTSELFNPWNKRRVPSKK